MEVLEIIFALFCICMPVLMIAAANGQRIKVKSCKMGYHVWPKNKYYCVNCKKGRGTLTVIDGHKKDVSSFRF